MKLLVSIAVLLKEETDALRKLLLSKTVNVVRFISKTMLLQILMHLLFVYIY